MTDDDTLNARSDELDENPAVQATFQERQRELKPAGGSFHDEVAEFPARVRRGIAWLDRIAPWWRDEFEITSFDVTSTCDCTLGQTFGSYWTVVPDLSPHPDSGVSVPDYAMTAREAVDRGFDLPHFADLVESEHPWEELNDAWRDALEAEGFE